MADDPCIRDGGQPAVRRVTPAEVVCGVLALANTAVLGAVWAATRQRRVTW